MFDTLTAEEQDTLRRMMHTGSQEAYKLAVFAAPVAWLWKQANGVGNDLSAIHEELCGVGSYFTRTADWNVPAEVFCRSCGFTHPAGTEDCPRWPVTA